MRTAGQFAKTEPVLVSGDVLEEYRDVGGYLHHCFIRYGCEDLVILLHGLGCSAQVFLPGIESLGLSTDATLVSVDLLGHGESDRTSEFSYQLEDYADLVVTLVDSLNVRNACVVGHSMGGAIGLLAAQEIKQCHSFVSLEGNLVGSDCFSAKKIASVSEQDFCTRLYPLAPSRFKGRAATKDPASFALHRSARSLVAWSESGELLSSFRGFKGRAVYVYGSSNVNNVPLDALAGNHIVAIPDASHYMMLENPRSTYDTIQKFC